MGSSTGRLDVGTRRLVGFADSGSDRRAEDDRRTGCGAGARARGCAGHGGPAWHWPGSVADRGDGAGRQRGVRTLFGEAFEYQQARPWPLKVTKEVVALYAHRPAQTDFHIFEGRGHSLTIDNWWKDLGGRGPAMAGR